MCLSFPVATAFSQQRRQGVSNVGTDAAVDTVTTAAADTAAGTWELVSVTYNGMTVGKEDLEEIGNCHDSGSPGGRCADAGKCRYRDGI